MTEDSTVPKIIAFLKIQIRLGEIVVPRLDNIGNFIKVHIRDKTGKDLKNTVDSAESRAKKAGKK